MPKLFDTDITTPFNITTSCQEPLEAAGVDTFWEQIEFVERTNRANYGLIFYFNHDNITDKDTAYQNGLAQQLISCLRGLGLPIGTLKMTKGKNLTDVGEEMKYLKVTTLDLYSNALSAIPDLCGGNIGKTLRVLDLYDNKLNETSDLQNLECLTALIELDLSYNRFTNLPDSLSSLDTLEELELRGNPLGDASNFSILTHLPKLATLGLSQTNLTNLPDSLSPLDTLEELDLNANPLGDASNFSILTQFPKLATLGLYATNLTNLPDSLSPLDTLEELDLSDNPLGDASNFSILTRTNFPKLATLWLSQTNLTKLPEPVKDILPQLEALYLFNTTACDNLIGASAWNVTKADAQKISC